jgi:pheromone shutdown protein TraB
MDLVTQQEGLNLSPFREKILNPDMGRRAFDQRWTSLPLSLRAQLFLLIPMWVAYLFFFGTRETIADQIALEDLPSSDEILIQDDSLDKLGTLLVDERDQKLIHSIERLHGSTRLNKQTAGVVYGAMHMRNIMNYLLGDLKYRVARAEWVTVFEL